MIAVYIGCALVAFFVMRRALKRRTAASAVPVRTLVYEPPAGRLGKRKREML